MRIKILLTFLLIPILLKSQTQADSLKLALVQYPDSTEIYLSIARPYLFSNIDSAGLYLNNGLEVANNNQNSYEQARVYDNLGIYYGIQSKYDSSQYYFKKSIKNFRELKDEFALANVLNNSGYILFKKGDDENASIHFQEAVDLYVKLDRLDKAARTYNNLGLVYIDINDLDKAMIFFEKAMASSKKINDDQTYFTAMSGKANTLDALLKFREALIQYDSAHDYFEKNDQPYFAAKVAHNIGDCYTELGEYEKADLYLSRSLAIKKQFNDQEVIASSYKALALLNQVQNNYSKALLYVDSAIQVAYSLENLSLIASNTRLKSSLLLDVGEYKKSSELFSKYVVFQDSLTEVLQTEKITELNNKYEVAKKDKELMLLTFENKQQQQELKITRIKYIGIGLAIFILAALAIFYMLQLRQRDQLRQQLLNEEIDGLRLRIARIITDVKLDEIAIDNQPMNGDALSALTVREVEILKQATTNKSNAEIAEILFISTNTVKYHLKNIYAKLGVNSKLEARAFFS
jgi:DNA-binding CsgD family transcriptional regulator/Tfp pilus assembly protein PilF